VDPLVSRGFVRDGADADVPEATSKRAKGRGADVSLTKPASHRAALLAHLAEDLKAAVLAGDVEAARVAHGAIGRLLGGEAAGEGGVVDLTAERARRCGSGQR
jgi:hypothetical protein